MIINNKTIINDTFYQSNVAMHIAFYDKFNEIICEMRCWETESKIRMFHLHFNLAEKRMNRDEVDNIMGTLQMLYRFLSGHYSYAKPEYTKITFHKITGRIGTISTVL